MENHNKESVYSTKVRAGKRRTYFFDVRQTKRDDYYITLTESTKRYEGEGYDRHKIFLYKEDFNRFQKHLGDTIDHVKTELLPDFDYEQYERRQAEWEASLDENGNPPPRPEVAETKGAEKAPAVEETPSTNEPSATDSEEDMSW